MYTRVDPLRKQRKTKRKTPGDNLAAYYDRHGVLGQLDEQPVEFALDEDLRAQILKGQRVRKLQNVSIKLDRVQIQALRKIATIKSIAYQTLIRHWLSEGIRRELQLDQS